jgi:hypothetical protein
MTTRNEFAIIGLRVLAVFLGIEVITQIPSWVSLWILFETSKSDFSVLWMFGFGVLLPLSNFLLPILLWILAPKISKKIVNYNIVMDNQKSGSPNYQAIIFAGIGVFIFIQIFPEIFIFFYQTLKAILRSQPGYIMPRPDPVYLIAYFIKMVLSLVLIFKAQSLSHLLNKFRDMGVAH